MVPVMGGPPKRPFLAARGPQQAKHELEEAAGLVGPVGKITVVNARDGEHADVIHEKAHDNGGPTDAGENGQDSGQVNGEKSDAFRPIDLLVSRRVPFDPPPQGLRGGLKRIVFNLRHNLSTS
jgi:hypothetical protein